MVVACICCSSVIYSIVLHKTSNLHVQTVSRWRMQQRGSGGWHAYHHHVTDTVMCAHTMAVSAREESLETALGRAKVALTRSLGYIKTRAAVVSHMQGPPGRDAHDGRPGQPGPAGYAGPKVCNTVLCADDGYGHACVCASAFCHRHASVSNTHLPNNSTCGVEDKSMHDACTKDRLWKARKYLKAE
jgi:hypothetical protein